jgi:hypothetical protein
MLNYIEYRKKTISERASSAAATPEKPRVTMPDQLAADLERTIDDFVGQLKQQLVQPMTAPEAQRGVWDRIKNWWANLWHGRYNQQNPYFWQNKLGDDLGRTAAEGVLPIPLEHYAVLREQAQLLEVALPSGAEKLQIMKVIDQWAAQFKRAVTSLASKYNTPVPAPVMSERLVERAIERATAGAGPGCWGRQSR